MIDLRPPPELLCLKTQARTSMGILLFQKSKESGKDVTKLRGLRLTLKIALTPRCSWDRQRGTRMRSAVTQSHGFAGGKRPATQYSRWTLSLQGYGRGGFYKHTRSIVRLATGVFTESGVWIRETPFPPCLPSAQALKENAR